VTAGSRALLALAIAGCSDPSFYIDREDAASLIVAQERDGAWTLEAKTIAEGRSTKLVSTDPIYLLLYQRTLTDLDLVAGPLSQAPPGRLLPEPDRGFRIDEAGPVVLDELPETLAGVRIMRPDPCYTIELAGQGSLEDATMLFFSASIEGRSLLSTDAGFYWVDADAIVPATELAPDLPREAGFWHEASRELWLIDGATGRVMHGDLSSGFARAVDLPRARPPIYVDGSRGDAPFELFVVTSSRALYRFDGQRWEERAPPRGFRQYSSVHQVAWAGPRRAVALSGLDDRVMEDDGTAVSDVLIPELNTGASDDVVRTVRYVEGYGPLVATDRGALYSYISPGWQVLHRAPTRTQAWIIEPLGLEGVLYGGEDGVLAQYQPGASCDSSALSPQADVPIIAWLTSGEQRTAIYPSAGPLLWARADVR
jgi:hypothetical protein